MRVRAIETARVCVCLCAPVSVPSVHLHMEKLQRDEFV